ncbi:hypothetical protein [Laspinema olomoucense]|uniref:hypothetical protein n=1 Tax=Laspinema olomoucense TaxID=3231600 RepID=UPI0021BAC804|nr:MULTISPECIES: hypothetical protein [unclassified Laspinema]MCT7971843.1 hypothetical protein [Laspinema sp. D3d]MCT7993447.1 hypothetical protein [Laspinema sp. D3c]
MSEQTAKLIISVALFPMLWGVISSARVLAQETEPCQVEARPGTSPVPACPPTLRTPIQPTFSEEERRGFEQRGFDNFLRDALNGNSDPMGGGTIGGAVESDAGLVPISPEVRGIEPTFDPTDVIIPRGGVRGR